jgi:hypothetical protein
LKRLPNARSKFNRFTGLELQRTKQTFGWEPVPKIDTFAPVGDERELTKLGGYRLSRTLASLLRNLKDSYQIILQM